MGLRLADTHAWVASGRGATRVYAQGVSEVRAVLLACGWLLIVCQSAVRHSVAL